MKTRTQNLKRLLSLLLCLCMVVGLLPTMVLAVTIDGSVSATIYLDDGDGQWMEDEEKTTFAVDQSELILHLDFSSSSLPSGGQVESIAFYPIDGSKPDGFVFWFDEESICNNGTKTDKLATAGVFQIKNFTPNGNGGSANLTPGIYKILVYANNGQTGGSYQSLNYLSTEIFTITGAMGPGEPVIDTATLLDAYVGEEYRQALHATPGTTGNALTWSVSSGRLPTGLQLDASTGEIFGTPTEEAVGSHSFTVRVSEAVEGGEPLTATQELTLKVTQRLAITNTEINFNLNRGQSVNEKLKANLEGVTWTIISGKLPSGLYLQDDVITGTVSGYADSDNYQVTVQAKADGQTAVKDFVFTVGDLFRFNLAGTIDSDAVDRYVYLRAEDSQNRDITLWSGKLTEGTQSLMINAGFAGAQVSNVQLITYASSSSSTASVLAEYTESTPLTLTDGESADLIGRGNNVLVKLPEITHDYGEGARIQTWFQESGVSYKTYQPGTIVAADTKFTLHGSASCSGEGDPLAECNLTTAIFTGPGVEGDDGNYTYNPAQNTSGASITVSYPVYERKSVTVTLKQTIGESDALDLSYAKLTFSQRLDRWTYSTDAVVGENNTCTVELYVGVEGWVTMTNAGNYSLASNTIAAGSINGNSLTLNVNGTQERSMAVLITGKLENDTDDFATYAAALGGSAYLQVEIGGRQWRVTTAYMSTLLKGSSRIGLWNSNYSKELSELLTNGGTLEFTYMGYNHLRDSSKEIEWTKGSLTGSVELPISLRGGVLFDLDYEGKNSILMKGWWHQTAMDDDTGESYDVWVEGSSKTAYTGMYAVNNTMAYYCPGDPGKWDFLLLPSIASPSGMTWEKALEEYPGMPNQSSVEIADNTVVNLGEKTLAARDADSVRYLTLPNSTFTGPQQFDTTDDTLVYTGHIELDEGADNKMRVLRLNAAGTDSGGRVSTQISSVVINGKEYPYTQIQLEDKSNYEKDKLVSVQFQTYYQIEFSDPMELPCDITVYAKPMSANSAAVLDMSVLLTEKSSYEPVDRVEVSAPSVSVEMPGTVGSKTFTAYVTIPEGGRVDVYDGVDLVGQAIRTGDIKITLSGASDSMITSHDLRFVLFDKSGNEAGAYTQTVLHANGAPTLRSQNLQTTTTGGRNWATHKRDMIYTFTSSNPPQFRMTCTFDHPENLKDNNVVFAVSLLDGTIRYMEGKEEKTGTFVTDIITTSSPVIGATVLYEIDWNKVNNIILQSQVVPSDSPTATGYNFDQTIVLNYADFKEELPTTIPSQTTQWTQEEQRAIETLRGQIVDVYEEHGDAGYYIIGDGSEFYTGQYMIEHLDPGVLPAGYTGETTFTRPLTQEQFEGELGGGEGWTRLTFTEPGETGGTGSSWGGAGEGGETGLEIYTTEFTTGNGVDGILTITRTGDGGITETGFATARGTGSGTATPLPESGTVDPGAFGSGEWFSFTNFQGRSDMEVFTNFCDDTGSSAGIAGNLLEILGTGGGEGVWKMLNGAGNILGAGKSTYDGLSNDASLQELHSSTMSLLDSPCAQKLTPNVRNNLQSQLNRFNDMAVEAMQWNTIVTLGGTGTGLAGAAGIMSNPFTALTAGIGLFGAGKINRQQIDNVRMEAQLARDNVQFQITKYAISSGDTDCAPKPKNNRNAGSSGKATYRVCIDPSGIVYEAVLSNPVAGATVTLYTADGTYVPQYAQNEAGLEVYVDKNGQPISPNNVNEYTGRGDLIVPNVGDLQPSELTLITGADGRYQWMVPAGLWYVTAEKGEAGYEPGNSNSDVAAVVKAGGKNWLPVLPAQLDVNIPLVSYAIPEITDIQYRADGVYLTFSKYMDNATLTEADAFQINDTAVDPADVELLNSEQAPANINYGSGDAPWYTSQVKLATSTTLSGEVTVIIGSGVTSYAGVPCTTKTEGMTLKGMVGEEMPVATPTFTLPGGKVPYGSTVAINCATDGAVLYYTTDGTTPTTASTRYYPGQTIAIDQDMTIQVLAVKPGYTKATALVTFTVPTDKNISIGDEYDQSGTNPGGGGGGVITYAVGLPGTTSGGTLAVSSKQAAKGDIITITVKPDQGYELDTLIVTDSKGNELALTPTGNNQYTFTMPASIVKIQVSFQEITEQVINPFTDVYESAYYYDAVLWAVKNGVTNGTSATTFSPDMTVTRAQMVTFLWRAHGAPKAAGSNPFIDVSSGAYYYDAVLWAVENGITNGTSATTFSPDDPVTRAQAVTFQWRSSGSPAASGDSFDDVAEDAYYTDAVTWAVANGITNGTGAGKFSPNSPVSRAQAVTFLYRDLT